MELKRQFQKETTQRVGVSEVESRVCYRNAKWSRSTGIEQTSQFVQQESLGRHSNSKSLDAELAKASLRCKTRHEERENCKCVGFWNQGSTLLVGRYQSCRIIATYIGTN